MMLKILHVSSLNINYRNGRKYKLFEGDLTIFLYGYLNFNYGTQYTEPIK